MTDWIESPSSNVQRFRYEPGTQTMEVTFRSGGTYTHAGVTQEQFDAFAGAASHGSHYHKHFRGRFSAARQE
jgi:hypothetical protein